MNDSAHYARKPEPAPSPADTASVRADGSSASGRKPLADDLTVITSSPPLAAPAASDSASRILEGRVMPGDRIGHFELVEYVGGGGMGRVFRATDTQLGRTVALKILPPEQAAGADAAQRFQNEAQSSARLDHENIARVYFVGEDDGLSYIVFEFVEGVNVRLLVEQKGPLPLAEALSYTIQVAEALAHADLRGVVHRDIKPSNVLITPEGRVKLIDMGLARLRSSDPAAADLTQSGVTLGTFDYISPEQARDPRNADIRSDIYSLGCTMFFMLAGQPPFPEGTVLQKLLQHQGDQPPDIRQLRPDLPEELSRVLRKMMAKDPRHRHATSTELATDLLVLAEQIGLRPMIPTSRVWLTPPDQSVPFFQRHLPWMAPVAALLCVVLLVSRLSEPRDDELPPLVAAAGKDTIEKSKPEKSISERAVASKDTWRKGPTKTDITKKGTLEEDATRTSVVATPPAKKPSRPLFPVDDLDMPSPLSQDPISEFPMSPLDTKKPEVVTRNPERKTIENPKPLPDAAAKRPDVLIVTENATGANEFSSLAAACNFAHKDDTIELRFNGPRREQPMKLSNQQVTVRAGAGYRPVIVFRPTEINPIISRSMFTLTAGRLTMIDVAVELHVPREIPADNWAMFETWGGQTIRLEHCSLTVRNESDQLAMYHQEVAFVRAKPAPDADMTVDNAPAATPLATIDLTDCIARGEAVFLCVEDLQPVYLLWKNGLLATTEQLLTAGGGQVAPKSDERLQVDLRHVTVAVRGGLCRLSATPANPYQLPVEITCIDNIIMTARGAPLVEQEGTAGLDKSRQPFVWKGDRNYYQDVDVFLMVRNMDSRIEPEVLNFEDWKARWGPSRENQASRNLLVWRRAPNADRPVHAQTANDYSLEDPTFNDASDGAPGFRADRLPPLPAESALERSNVPVSSARGARRKSVGTRGRA